MSPGLFDTAHLGEVALRTACVYVFLLAALRLAGKREVGQMKPFDLVTLLILSNAVQNAMVGADSSLTGGLLAAAVILLLNRLVAAARGRWGRAAAVLEGSPSLLVYDGHLLADNLRREGLSEPDVLQAMREHGVEAVADVKLAVLEVDGTISIVPKDKAAAVTRTHRRVRRQQRQV
jgi:uncharacterized membrane protein YcaP (DUF421 family)